MAISTNRHWRYKRAIERAADTQSSGIDGRVEYINERQASLSLAELVDRADPDFAFIYNQRCRKSGRPLGGMAPADVRDLIHAIGRPATIERLQAQCRVACHPIWLHTDSDALRANLIIDPAGSFVYLMTRIIGTEDTPSDVTIKGHLYEVMLEWQGTRLNRCNELMRNLMAMAEPKVIRAMLGAGCRDYLLSLANTFTPEPETILQSSMQAGAAIDAWHDALVTCHRTILEQYLAKHWQQYKDRGRLVPEDAKRITYYLKGSAQMKGTVHPKEKIANAAIMADLEALGFAVGKPERAIGLTEAERAQEDASDEALMAIAAQSATELTGQSIKVPTVQPAPNPRLIVNRTTEKRDSTVVPPTTGIRIKLRGSK